MSKKALLDRAGRGVAEGRVGGLDLLGVEVGFGREAFIGGSVDAEVLDLSGGEKK